MDSQNRNVYKCPIHLHVKQMPLSVIKHQKAFILHVYGLFWLHNNLICNKDQ